MKEGASLRKLLQKSAWSKHWVQTKALEALYGTCLAKVQRLLPSL